MCKSSYFSPTSEGHPEMLASHKIAYQFLLPCNPSTILLLSVGINRESTHFVFIRRTNIIEKINKICYQDFIKKRFIYPISIYRNKILFIRKI